VTSVGQPARDFILKLGRGMHAYGYPAHRLEDALTDVSERLGVRGHYFSMPTALFASFEETDGQRTYQIRVEPGGVDLEKLAQLDAVATDVAKGALSPAEGGERLDAITAAPPRYGSLVNIAAFAVASGAASRFFDAGPHEMTVAAGIGLLTGLLSVASGKVPALGRVFEPLASAVAAFVASAAARHFPPLSFYVATVAGLIVLVPGFPLTVALTELATRNLVSGTARLMGAVGTFLAMGFGVAFGTTLGTRIFGSVPVTASAALPEWTLYAALLAAPLGFTILLRAHPREAPWIILSGSLGFFGARTGARLLGPEIGAFLGAFAVSAFGNLYARLVRRPFAITVVPGLLLLVPGSVGFRSFSLLLEDQTVTGIGTAFTMMMVAISLAIGLLFGNVVLPARSRGIIRAFLKEPS
jgi:uncharacterized membrane protein YjjP (DUF1212 family)